MMMMNAVMIMLCMVLAVVLGHAIDASPTRPLSAFDEEQHGNGFDYSPIIRTIQSQFQLRRNDAMLPLYSESAVLRKCGKEYIGVDAMVGFWQMWWNATVHVEFTLTSPIYTNGMAIHFTQEAFMQGPAGCGVIVHSLEEMEFNIDGLIIAERSEWAEDPGYVEQDLRCHHSDHSEHHELSERGMSMAIAFQDMLFGLESLEPDTFINHWADSEHRVRWLLFGGSEHLGRDAIVQAATPITFQLRRASITPSSRMYVSKNTVSCVVSLLGVTKTGCMVSTNMIWYTEFSADVKIVAALTYLENRSPADWSEEMAVDCGRAENIDDNMFPMHNEL